MSVLEMFVIEKKIILWSFYVQVFYLKVSSASRSKDATIVYVDFESEFGTK